MLDPILHSLDFLARDTAHGRLARLHALLPLQPLQHAQGRVHVRMAEVGHGEAVLAVVLGARAARHAVQRALHEPAGEEGHGLADVDEHGAGDDGRVEPHLIRRDRARVLGRPHLQARHVVLEQDRDDALVRVRPQSDVCVVRLAQRRVVDQPQRRHRRPRVLVQPRHLRRRDVQPVGQQSQQGHRDLLVHVLHERLDLRVEGLQPRRHGLVRHRPFLADHKHLLAVPARNLVRPAVLLEVVLRARVGVVARVVDAVPRRRLLLGFRRRLEKRRADRKHAVDGRLREPVVLHVQEPPCLADLLDFGCEIGGRRKVDDGDGVCGGHIFVFDFSPF